MLKRILIALLLGLAMISSAQARSFHRRSEAIQARSFAAPPILARAGVVMDAVTGRVLTERNPHLRLPMASTTKIMTAILALQLGHLSNRIRVPSAAFNYESDATVMGLRPGETVTLSDLLYGLLLPSGADAANTIAIHYGGSEARFITLMNREATTLGLHDTHYADATGLTSAHHYSTAYDLARLAQFASTIPALMAVVDTRIHHWNGFILTNVNQVLFWYPGVDGIKPGFTYEAGLCQVLDARRDGRHVIVTLLNTPNLDTDARNLLDYGLHDFSWVRSHLPGDRPSLAQYGADLRGRYSYFTATGHYLRPPFAKAFTANGGLSVLGYPRTEPLTEGHQRVQYFQNGALALDTTSGKIQRMALGTLVSPPVPSTPPPTPTPIATPPEGTVTVASETPGPRATATPQPRRTATPIPTPPPNVAPHVAGPLRAFTQARGHWLGRPMLPAIQTSGYTVQLFTYGALAANARTHAVYLLPVGDRLLAARHWLPDHPGNAYPTGFASTSVVRAIGWLAHP